jgi:hypothetical protein
MEEAGGPIDRNHGRRWPRAQVDFTPSCASKYRSGASPRSAHKSPYPIAPLSDLTGRRKAKNAEFGRIALYVFLRSESYPAH